MIEAQLVYFFFDWIMFNALVGVILGAVVAFRR